MTHLLEGLAIGILVGLLVRPLLDGYLQWRLIQHYRALDERPLARSRTDV